MTEVIGRAYSVYVSVGPHSSGGISMEAEDILEALSGKVSELYPDASAVLGITSAGGTDAEYGFDASMDIEAASAREAKDEAFGIMEAAYRAVAVEAGSSESALRLLHSEVEVSESEADPRGSAGSGDEQRFCGVSEVGNLLGLKNRQHAATVVRRWEFPRPIQVLAMGPIWREEEVLRYAADHGFETGGTAAGRER